MEEKKTIPRLRADRGRVADAQARALSADVKAREALELASHAADVAHSAERWGVYALMLVGVVAFCGWLLEGRVDALAEATLPAAP